MMDSRTCATAMTTITDSAVNFLTCAHLTPARTKAAALDLMAPWDIPVTARFLSVGRTVPPSLTPVWRSNRVSTVIAVQQGRVPTAAIAIQGGQAGIVTWISWTVP